MTEVDAKYEHSLRTIHNRESIQTDIYPLYQLKGQQSTALPIGFHSTLQLFLSDVWHSCLHSACHNHSHSHSPLSVSPQQPIPRSHLALKRGLGIGPIPGDKTTLFNTPWQRTRFLCGFHARYVGLLPLGNMTKLTGEDFICNGDRAACRIQITSRRFAEQTTIVPLLYEHRHLPLQSVQAITSLPTTPVPEFSLFRT